MIIVIIMGLFAIPLTVSWITVFTENPEDVLAVSLTTLVYLLAWIPILKVIKW